MKSKLMLASLAIAVATAGPASADSSIKIGFITKFPVPFFKDWRNTVADRYGATLTPEAIVIDANGASRYQGAIDDARNEARVKIEAVKRAVEDLLAGRPVSVKPIRAFGCAIKKVT